jgi:hypothetical protein
MKLNAMFLAAALGVAGCGGGGTNPFMDQQSSTTTTEATGTDENTVTSSGGDGDTSTDQNGITSTGTPDAGTGTTGDKIEDMSWSSTSGHPRNVSYVKEPDENGIDVEKLYIENIPFDGLPTMAYSRITGFPTGPGIGFFANDLTVIDPVTNETIDQDQYLALFGKSESGALEFVIVKTAWYNDEGPGGYIVQRNQYDATGAAVLFERPSDSQARFTGTYDGFRIPISTDGNMHHTKGDVMIDFDFKDFLDRGAIYFQMQNRDVFDSYGGYLYSLPDLGTVVDSGNLAADGSYTLKVFSNDKDGNKFESGDLVGVLAGKTPVENVGILYLTSTEGSIQFKETGAFFAYRKPAQ